MDECHLVDGKEEWGSRLLNRPFLRMRYYKFTRTHDRFDPRVWYF